MHVWETLEMQRGFLYENLKERDHLDDAGINGSIIKE